jgi:DNA-binding HxlR family transcriptional regulator
MPPTPGTPVRGSTSGRPLMLLLDRLGQRWSLRILFELRDEPASFRDLQARCDAISPTVLNSRLKMLRDLDLVDLAADGYRLTPWGRDIGSHFARLDQWATHWAARSDGQSPDDDVAAPNGPG